MTLNDEIEIALLSVLIERIEVLTMAIEDNTRAKIRIAKRLDEIE